MMSIDDDYNRLKYLFDDKSILDMKGILSFKGITYKNIRSKMRNIGIKKKESYSFTKEDCVKLYLSFLRKEIDENQ